MRLPECGVAGNTLLAAMLSFLVALPVYHWIEEPCAKWIRNRK